MRIPTIDLLQIMSRFVAEGATNEPLQVNDKWAEAEKLIKHTQDRKDAETGRQEDGKSLYEV